MTEAQQRAYWRKYARENAKYERNGVILFSRAITDTIAPVKTYATRNGAQAALDLLDVLVTKSFIQRAFEEFYLYVGTTHKTWTDEQMPKKKDRGVPRGLVPSADAGFGSGFFNPEWLRRLKRLVYEGEAAKRIVSVTNRIKKKLRAVLGRAVKEEVRPSRIATRIADEMEGKITVARARLIARTETTYIANLAAKESAKETIAYGIDLVKFWVSTQDERTRDHHKDVDGPKDFEEKFEVGDKLMDVPGDPEGGAEECCNCRCCVAYFPKDDFIDTLTNIKR